MLLLNPDTLVLDGAIDRLVAFADRTPEAGIWGGRTLYADGSLNAGQLQRRCRRSGASSAAPPASPSSSAAAPSSIREDYGAWDRSTEREVGYVCGCFFLIKRAFWDELGGFDLTFVMYGEETDLCHRARARGARPRVTPDATIVHYAGASSKRRSDKDVLILKSKVTLAQRYLPRWQHGPAVFLLRMWPLSAQARRRAARPR